MFRFRFRYVAGLLGAIVLIVTGCSSSSHSSSTATTGGGSATTLSGLTASAPGITPTTIKIGLITSETGSASSQYLNLPKAAMARFDVQNANGGVDGRQLKLMTCDDTSTPTGNLTCSQALVSQSVFGVIDESAFAFGGYQVLQKDGIPVTGGAFDGTEWGQLPNTNMFAFGGPPDPHQPQYTQPTLLMKQMGVTTVATFGYGVSPSSSNAAKGFAFAAQYNGLKVGLLDDTLPFGTVSVVPLALKMKSAGVDGLYLPLDANTNFAILTAAKQEGVNLKVVISATGYGQTLLDTPSALQSAQGTYFPPVAAPVELNTPATQAMQAAFSQYAGYTGVPDFQWYQGWLSADLMIEGLNVAGHNPTRAAFINHLHLVTNYNGGGLLAAPTNFATDLIGTAKQTQCGWYGILQADKFTIANNGQTVCGQLIPNSNQA